MNSKDFMKMFQEGMRKGQTSLEQISQKLFTNING